MSSRLVVAVLLAALCLLAFTFDGAGAGVSRTASAFDGATFTVDAVSNSRGSFLALSVKLEGSSQLGGAPPLASSVDVAVPAGYHLDLSAAPGTSLGDFSGGVVDAADGSGFTFADGDIVVDDPGVYAADPVAQACAPGPHAAVWRASLSVVGRTLPFTIAVDPAGAADTATRAYTLRFCPLQAPSPAFPGGVAFLFSYLFLYDVVSTPTTPGDFLWSALVTPAAGFAPDPGAAFELRAHIVTPLTLELAARYDAKTKSASVNGRLVAAGKPGAGLPIDIGSVNPAGDVTLLTTVQTDATGSFQLTRAVARTTRFAAAVDPGTGACVAPSAAPGGCRSETSSSPGIATALAVVPRKTDPRSAIRPRDQALAKRSVLAAADFPSSWLVQQDFPGPCEGFAPDLRQLTVTGKVYSPVIYAADGGVAAYSTATVFRNLADATAGFAGMSKLAAAKCVAKSNVSADDTVTRVRPLALTAGGDALHAYRAVLSSSEGKDIIDLAFVRVGRVVVELGVYSAGISETGLDVDLLHKIVARARAR